MQQPNFITTGDQEHDSSIANSATAKKRDQKGTMKAVANQSKQIKKR